ncbi:hypothetical protein EYE40_04775 [Glaciihabitans arcticus]|uniref:SHOCT domain-containing protein n=1 Tax=Glaciihabitans arcticus TaxID=2668039 RepID=A0A4Q9GT09_9MICO|nr:hypothetical protein [Glaciihabitans arcticus]TBN56768.1 hypothetical protein EYE40_04775 [Glaciihabitans arcticus]
MPPETPAADPTSAIAAIIGVIALIAVFGFVLLIVGRARNLRRVMKSRPTMPMFDADLPPSRPQERPERSTEFRLATLDNLMMQGKITADEYKEARAKVLGDV